MDDHQPVAAVTAGSASQDDFTGDSGGGAPRPVFAALAPSSYQPGFINMTVPENSPISGSALPLDTSPGQVSMELTLPVQQQQQVQPRLASGAGEAGEGGLGTWRSRVLGEVTAALPSLGALAEADELEDELQGRLGAGGEAGWEGLEPTVNLTASITAALPGLKDLVAEDEDATAGMDLTEPTGHVLQAQQPQQAAAGVVAGAAVPVAGALLRPSAAEQVEQQEEQAHGAATAAGWEAGQVQQEAQPLGVTRMSSGSDELAAGRKVASMVNKWGFAPGQEDTLDINLEMHGACLLPCPAALRSWALG